MSYLDDILRMVGGAASGITTPEMDPSYRLSPTMDAWRSPFFAIGSQVGKQLEQVQSSVELPDSKMFVLGDELADKQARRVGVDPAATGSFLQLAKSQLGVPYVWAAANPEGQEGGPGAGFDCSGFTQWVVKRATGGKTVLPHYAKAQAAELPNVSKDALRPGDLVFFSYGRLGAGVVDHVGLYVGNGKMIAASSSNDAITEQTVDWAHFVQGGRVAGMSDASVSSLTGKRPGKKPGAPEKPQGNALAPAQLGSQYFTQSVFPLVSGSQAAVMAKNGGLPTDGSQLTTIGDYRRAAKRIAQQKFGWTGAQWDAINWIFSNESGWNPNATNATTGATGIPQLNPQSHDVPQNWSDPIVQIMWGLNYIKGRYGNPLNAQSFKEQHGWY